MNLNSIVKKFLGGVISMNMLNQIQTESEDLIKEKQAMIKLGKQIMNKWDIKVYEIEPIQWGQITLVWKMKSDQGLICLKKLNRPEKSALFSIRAQEYLNKNGIHVPGIFPNKNNELYTTVGSAIFVVYDWIEGTHLDITLKEDRKKLMRELAKFHKASIGYEPLTGIPVVTKLGKWPDHYLKLCQQLESWKSLAIMQPDDKFSQIYLQEINFFIKQGRELHKKLLNSDYSLWVEKTKKAPNLCHPDYGTGNTLLGYDGHFWLIDLDTVCFDLPIRDIRKMFESCVKPEDPWDDTIVQTLLSAYESVTPLTNREKKILMIDLLFPHKLYSIAQKKYYMKEPISSDELIKFIEFEKIKGKKLSEINF